MKKERFITEKLYTLLLALNVPLSIGYMLLMYFLLNLMGSRVEIGMEVEDRLLKAAAIGYFVLAAIFIVAVTVLGLMSVIKAFRTFNKSAEDCVRGMLIHKTRMIAFFVINMVWDVFFSLFLLAASRGTFILFMPIVWTVMVYFTWITLIPGGVWGIQAARASVKEKGMSKPQAVLHGILQFVFMVDVLDCLYLAAIKWGMGKKRAVVILVLYAVLIALAVIGVIKIQNAFQALGS